MLREALRTAMREHSPIVSQRYDFFSLLATSPAKIYLASATFSPTRETL